MQSLALIPTFTLCLVDMLHSEAPLPYSANTYYNQAELLKNGGKTAEAIAAYKNAITVNPDHFDAHFYLANEFFKIGNYDEAIHHYQRAVGLRNDCAPAYYNLGVTLCICNRHEQAFEPLEKAIYLYPNHVRARLLFGSLLQQKKEYKAAKQQFDEVLSHEPCNGDALMSCARLARDEGNVQEAADYYKKATHYCPTNFHAHFEHAYMYHQAGDFDNAITSYTRALELNPCAEAFLNRAHTFRYCGHMTQAASDYQKALQQLPADSHAHYGYAETLLALGDLEQGFAEFEWRWKREPDVRNFSHNLWDGSSLAGKTILLRAEYGQGDTLQFIRYAKHLKKMGATVILEAQPTLVKLLSRCSFLDRVIAVNDPLPAYDVQVPLMSLPHCFGTTLETIPQEIPYVHADPALVAAWGKELSADGSFKIGICWHTSPYYNAMRSPLSQKSIPLSAFAPISRIEGVRLYSLQCVDGTEQLRNLPEGMVVRELGPDFDVTQGSFMDSAAVIQHLDLVISADTSIAHLAGALGVPVWVMLPYVPDWRWMLDRQDSPWYFTMRLFRQQAPGNWHEPIDEVARTLVEYIKIVKQTGSMITAEISIGELLDKMTILEIKQEEISDSSKLCNINKELSILRGTRAQISSSPHIRDLYTKLKRVNKELWDIEDNIREKERARCFDEGFIKLAREVYITNDLRCKIKRQINDILGSRLVEEKSYKDYQSTSVAA
jgi:tetratricopeptide (TPR) repeat protein